MDSQNSRYALSTLFGDATRDGASDWLYTRCKAIIYHKHIPVHPLTPGADLAQIDARYSPQISTYMHKHQIVKLDGSTCSLLPLPDAEAIRRSCAPHAESFLDRTIRNLGEQQYRILLPIANPNDYLVALQQLNRRFHFRSHPLAIQKVGDKYHIAFTPAQFERLTDQWRQENIDPNRDDFITHVTRPVHKSLSALGLPATQQRPQTRPSAQIALFPSPESRPERIVNDDERTLEGKLLYLPGHRK